MPTSECYRKQAEICAQLALISSDPTVIARCNTMVLEHLARAAELDGLTGGIQTRIAIPSNGSDIHRD